MTEAGHGSNVQAPGTTATYDAEAGEFVIRTPDGSSRKDYIGNAAAHGTVAVVFAQLVVKGESRGVHALVVPIRDERRSPAGVRIEDCGRKIGLNGVDNGRLWFDDVRVPRTALLNRYAEVTEDGEYHSPIENADRRFFTMLGTYALHFAQEHLVADLHRVISQEDGDEHARRSLESRAAGTKALGTWHATGTIQTCREACGGAGYLSVNRFDALRADTDVFTTFEGDNTILLQLVAKGLLTNYRDAFGELDQLGMVRFVASMAVETVLERTAVHKVLERIRDAVPAGDADTDPDRGLLDLEYHLDLFRWREEHLLAGVARRLKRSTDEGGKATEVFSRCQDHVIAAAWAHVERLVLEDFVAKVEAMPQGANRDAMNLLCDLFARAAIEEDRAWFMEHGRLSSARSKAVTVMVNELCRRVRPVREDLVDAFAIPSDMLRAEIID